MWYDDNLNHQFKYTNIPQPDAAPDAGSDADDEVTNWRNTLLLEIQNDILQKTDPAIVFPKLDSFIVDWKNDIFDGVMQMSFAIIVKMSKTRTSSKAWINKFNKQKSRIL